jgi:hypothetical protein
MPDHPLQPAQAGFAVACNATLRRGFSRQPPAASRRTRKKAARPIVRESRTNRETSDCLLRVRLIFQGAYSLPELAPRQRIFSTRRRLLGVIGPFPTPVWMSWRAAPCATQSITSAGLARQATISARGRFPSLPQARYRWYETCPRTTCCCVTIMRQPGLNKKLPGWQARIVTRAPVCALVLICSSSLVSGTIGTALRRHRGDSTEARSFRGRNGPATLRHSTAQHGTASGRRRPWQR